MEIDPMIGAVMMVLLGLVIAMAGYWLFKGFAGLLGAIVLGGGSFLIGLWVGGLFGGVLGLGIAIVMGLIGAAIGAFLAITAATVILAIGSGIFAFSAAATIGARMGLSDTWAAVTGIAVAILAAGLFLVLSRTMVKAASAVLGGFLVASGSYHLLDRFTSLGDDIVFPAAMVILIIVASVGFFVQTATDVKDRRQAGRQRERGRERGRGTSGPRHVR